MSLADYLRDWHPDNDIRTERLSPGPMRGLAALLDRTVAADEGSPLPPLWHWLYFLDALPQSALGPDGHPRDGGFLPPIPHRRRMFAGGRLTVHRPLTIGDEVTRVSTLERTTLKQGSTSELLFVTVRNEFSVGGTPMVVEESDLVYRSDDSATPAAASGPPIEPAPATDAPWQLTFTADPVRLFRFSALTGNAHRIHYDEPYTREVEGFSGLVVHGPLLALLLLELPRRFAPERTVASFEFRARKPIFAGQPFTVHGRDDDPGIGTWNLAIDTGNAPEAMTGSVWLN
ncbi:MaoC family dehydratase N-terminal domain-containing protein [Nocardia sp. NPDC052278]|uniref:FAS1-like dehydratase domain-containing protein n=1 Tax=unclassified Nocardia TaxID=2637762 RepID=UPI0036BE443A